MSLVEGIGLAATMTTVAQLLIQVRQILVSSSIVGISFLTWLLASVQSSGLAVYAISAGYLAASAVNLLVGSICFFIIFLLIGQRHRILRDCAAVLLVQLIVVVVFFGFGPRSTGAFAAVTAAFVWLPQAVRAAVTRSPDGLSRNFVAAGVLSSVLWLVYAGAHRDWRLAVAPSTALVSMLATGALIFHVRRGDHRDRHR